MFVLANHILFITNSIQYIVRRHLQVANKHKFTEIFAECNCEMTFIQRNRVHSSIMSLISSAGGWAAKRPGGRPGEEFDRASKRVNESVNE